MERVAEAAARESQELKMVEYLAAFVGQSFSAVISGVAAWGLYVRLDCTAEGILPVRALGDEYFVFDPVRYTLVGDESGKVYRLGQRVAVTLKSADATTASPGVRAGRKTLRDGVVEGAARGREIEYGKHLHRAVSVSPLARGPARFLSVPSSIWFCAFVLVQREDGLSV